MGRRLVVRRSLSAGLAAAACAPGSSATSPTTTASSSTTTTASTTDATTGQGDGASSSTGHASSSSGGAPDTSGGSQGIESGETTDAPPPDLPGPVDCDAVVPGPLPFTFKAGLPSAEDFAFDHLGNLVSTDAGNIVRTPYDGPTELWVPGANAHTGLRATSEGLFVFAMQDTLSRVGEGDVPEVVLGGMQYPNAIEVDDAGMAFVAEMAAGRVRRVDPHTTESWVVGEGFSAPNGLAFDTTYRHLYVASNLSGDIEVIDFDDTMTPLGPPTFFAAPGSANLTGLGVDACDNVYALDATAATVLRIRAEDATVEVLVEAGADSVALGNLQWGSGLGGWDRETLYVLDAIGDRVVEIEVGVPDKPRAYP